VNSLPVAGRWPLVSSRAPATSKLQQEIKSMSIQLIDAVADVLELAGAAVEKNGEYLEAIVPNEAAKILHTPEMAKLYFDPARAQKGGELVTFQSDFVDRLFLLMRGNGNYAHLALQNVYLKQSAKSAADQRFAALNGLGRAWDAIERRLSYALFNFKYTAVSDEKKEGLVTAIINEHTLADVSAMVTYLEWAEAAERSHHAELPRQSFQAIYQAACRSVESAIHRELAEFRKSLNRRLQRDIARLAEYYESLIIEIRRKIARRQLEGKEREDEESRIRATEMELQRKIVDQREKYAMKINVEPISLLRIFMPVMAVNFEVRFRKAVREIPLIWNPVTKDFEMVNCQSCATGLFHFFVCEEKLHTVCADCFKCSGCSRNVCHACHPQKCPKCGAAYQGILISNQVTSDT
jgi:hypothetical protein